MGAFNTIYKIEICKKCNNKVEFEVQFKYGDVWQNHYELGNSLIWGGNDIGKKDYKKVVVEGVADCPNCHEEILFTIYINNNIISRIELFNDEYYFDNGDADFVILEE